MKQVLTGPCHCRAALASLMPWRQGAHACPGTPYRCNSLVKPNQAPTPLWAQGVGTLLNIPIGSWEVGNLDLGFAPSPFLFTACPIAPEMVIRRAREFLCCLAWVIWQRRLFQREPGKQQAQVVINTCLRQYNDICPHHALSIRPPVPETKLEKPQMFGPD
jgi:hypothetical protein